MNWLFLVGLSFDGVGALLLAWPILRPGSAAREAARPRWGGDHWASFRRDRELRLVLCGALALAGGFALQALAYVIQVDESWVPAVALVGAIVLAGLLVGTALARRGLPVHVWRTELTPKDRIADGLDTYGVRNTSDLETVVERFLLEARGIAVEPIDEQSTAVVSSGRWTVFCPRCHQPTGATTPPWGRAICTACGASYRVGYPSAEEQRKIERTLIPREPESRSWPGG